jgi:hypothetical protein
MLFGVTYSELGKQMEKESVFHFLLSSFLDIVDSNTCTQQPQSIGMKMVD